MKSKKKFVLAGLVLLAAIITGLTLISCETEVDPSTPQQEQTDGNTGNSDGGNTQQPGGDNSGNEDEVGGEKPVTYTVTFNANGGTGTMESQTFIEGMEQELSANQFKRDTWTFSGWSEDKAATTATYGDKAKFKATKNTTLYAVWTDNGIVASVTFDPASGTSFPTDQPIEVSLSTSTEGATVQYKLDDGEWQDYNAESKIFVTTSTTITARATKEDMKDSAETTATYHPLYIVTFNGNNSTDDSMVTQTFTEGVAQELRANGFSRIGYGFAGWSEDENATTPTWRNKAEFTATKDTTLYAVWDNETLRFSAAAAQTLTIIASGDMIIPESMEYSVDGGEWQKPVLGTGIAFGGDTGDLRLRATSSIGTAESKHKYLQFSFGDSKVQVACSGDIRTLVDYEKPATANTSNARFCYLFKYCGSLTQAPALPAETLADYCYYYLFQKCSSLTQAPALPAETLAESCYEGMFYECGKLAQAPALNATTLASSCYKHMFYECGSLTQAPALPAETLADYCYYYMFQSCSSLSQVPALPAEDLAEGCYMGMFYECGKLTQAPALNATTLAIGCYKMMFMRCSKLDAVTMLATTELDALMALEDWLNETAAAGTLTVASEEVKSQFEAGTYPKPDGWTVVVK